MVEAPSALCRLLSVALVCRVAKKLALAGKPAAASTSFPYMLQLSSVTREGKDRQVWTKMPISMHYLELLTWIREPQSHGMMHQ